MDAEDSNKTEPETTNRTRFIFLAPIWPNVGGHLFVEGAAFGE
jgi:hypothetical protein